MKLDREKKTATSEDIKTLAKLTNSTLEEARIAIEGMGYRIELSSK